MNNVLLPAALLASLSTTALADTLPQTDAPAKPSVALAANGEPGVPTAIGVNLPVGWIDGSSFAGSLYVGLSKRLALRANVANYAYHSNAFVGLLGALAEAESEEGVSGRIMDVGVGVVHYSNKLWDGFTVEAGLLRRGKDYSSTDDFADPAYIATDTVAYSVRGLVGYSWLIQDHFFISFAVGMSGGRENGTETTKMETHTSAPSTTTSVSRWDATAEGYLRIGGAFESFGGN